MRYLTQMTWAQVDALDRDRTAILIPVGSVEQHGKHLPLGTDYLLAKKLAEALSQTEVEGWDCVITPALPFGENTEHIRFPGTICLQRHTLDCILAEQVDSLRRHGFSRFVLLNTHGGNFGLLDAFVRTYKTAHGVHMVNLDYYRCSAVKGQPGLLKNPIGMDIHAGEFETSLMLYLYPDLVDMDRPAAELCECNVNSRQLPGGWLTHEVSRSGVMGDATLADRERGKQCFERIVRYTGQAIRDFLMATLP